MSSVLAIGLVFGSLGCTRAVAAPDCWGVTALNSSNKKVVRITCSNPNTPGTAPNYACSFEWRVRTVDSAAHTLRGNFVSIRGENNALKYEEYRIDGKDIDDEAEGISISCHAQ